MKPQIYFYLLGRIVLLFGIAFFISWVTESNHVWLGDTRGAGEWNWSGRHYWLAWGGGIMFLFSFVELIFSGIAQFRKHYPEQFKNLFG